MNPILSNLLSGFLGALVGAAGTACIAYFRGRLASTNRLRAVLLRIGYDLYHAPSEQTTYDIIHPDYFTLTECAYELPFFLPNRGADIRQRVDDLLGRTGHPSIDVHCHAYPERSKARELVQRLCEIIE